MNIYINLFISKVTIIRQFREKLIRDLYKNNLLKN